MNTLYWQSYSGCGGCSVLNSVNIGKYIFFSVILKIELRTFKRWEKPPFYVKYKFGQNKANGLALDEQKIRKALDRILDDCKAYFSWKVYQNILSRFLVELKKRTLVFF